MNRRTRAGGLPRIGFLSNAVLCYNVGMTPKLPNELADAVDASGQMPVEVEHPNTHATYFVVEGETHRQAMDALRRQKDRDAIQEGIDQMEAGEGVPLDKAFERVGQKLDLPPRT